MKVAVCTPVRDEPEALYAQCLDRLRARTLEERPDVELIYGTRRGELLENRNRLANGALTSGADWLLWIDADMTFPPDALLRLLAHNVDIVGCNCARREEVTFPTASRNNERGELELIWTTRERASNPELEPVVGMGLGVCLISSAAMRAVPQPWFRILPNVAGEDILFFWQARAAGFQPYVDHALSWEIGHIHEGKIITNAQAEAQKLEYQVGQWAESVRKFQRGYEAGFARRSAPTGRTSRTKRLKQRLLSSPSSKP